MKIVRGVIFVVIVAIGFGLIQTLFMRKSGSSAAIRDFYETPHDVDVIAVGPSYVYCTYNTVEAYRVAGLSSYLPCTPCQPIEVSYYFLKGAFKSYHPRVAVLGATMFVFDAKPYVCADAFLHEATDNMASNFDKIKMLDDCVLTEAVETHLIPFMKYHSRWRELGKVDFSRHFENRSYFYGFPIKDKIFDSKGDKLIDLTNVAPAPVHPECLAWLDRFAALAKENGCPLVLLISPRFDGDKRRLGRYVTLCQRARELGVEVINLNSLPLRDDDFYDGGHLNVIGSEKATKHIVKFLQEHFDLKPSMSDAEKSRWEEMSKRYDEQKAAALKKSKRKVK